MKKHYLPKHLMLLLALQFLASCAAPSPQATATSTVAAPIETATPTLQPIIECQGQGVLQEWGPGLTFPGTLVYYDYSQKKSVFLSGETHQIWDAPLTDVSNKLIGFSPNGEWLAYQSYPATFHLFSAMGETKVFDADPDPLFTLIAEDTHLETPIWPAWVNDHVIAMFATNPQEYDPNYRFMIYLDPFTNEWLLFDIYSLKDFYFSGRGIPSPDLSRIIYFPIVQNGKQYLTLVDVTTKEELRALYNYSNFVTVDVPYNYIAWTNGSEKVAFFDHNYESKLMLSIWSRDGKVIHEFLLDEYEDASVLRWSTDGNNLAIGVYRKRGDSPLDFSDSILVYDQNLKQITHSCPVPDGFYVRDFVWVSDEPAIVYLSDSGSYDQGRLIYLDLSDGTSTLIADNVGQFGGWSAEFKQQ
jgi:hypothetical protein